MNYETMPWGKFKGQRIIDLPPNYLTYSLIEFDLPIELRQLMIKVLLQHIDPYNQINSFENIESEKVKNVYKKLCLKYHPDKGGNTEAMQAINDFRRMLNEQ
jgi:uncharacterized protein (DUF3820 family)